MKEKLVKLIREEEGQGMVEYGLIIGLVAILVIGALTLMQGSISAVFTKITTALGLV